ncbi:MAG: cytochrome P450 [Luminiphilus sp.]|nr:cytochrome P450 [Luminiphilus sp.]
MPTNWSEVPESLRCDIDIVADSALSQDPQACMLAWLAQEQRSLAYTPHNDGHWIIFTHKLAHQVLCDAKNFGSFPIGVPANYQQRPRLIPLESGPDEHRRYRRLLLPVFQPDVVKTMESSVRAHACAVLDAVMGNDKIDFLSDIAKPIPTRVFAEQMGLESTMLPQFYAWETGFYRAPTLEERLACGQQIALHLQQVVEQHQKQPGAGNIVDLLLAAEVEGERLTAEEVQGIAYLLFLAGIDTVASMLSFTILQLARNPHQYAQLHEDPEKVAASVEEFLRLNAFISLNRICEQDIEIEGVLIKAGDNVVVPSAITSRDPQVFGAPDTFDSNRSRGEQNRHHAFGAGAHKCVGLHLAKLEVRVVLEEFCRRVGSVSLSSDRKIIGHGGTTMGLDALPVDLHWAAQ